MKKYEAYKDSGVQWLGEIPSHWGLLPFKSNFILGKGLSITKENLTETGTNVISYGQIHSKSNVVTKVVDDLYRHVSPDYIYTAPQCLTHKEDFLFADTSEDVEGSGNFVRIDNDETTFAGYHTIIARNRVPKNGHFLSYLFQSPKWKQQIWTKVHGVKVFSVSRGILNACKIIVPPSNEQQAIVSYLDDKCAKLDQLVTNKEKEIELLQEMKQRVIADAVTRGLNPNVKFKDTGISWLPQIPEHWEFIKLKAFCKDNKEKNRDNVETQVLSLSYGKVIVKQNINFGLVPDSYETYQIVNPGYIILRLTDLQNDHKSLRTGLVKDRGIITSAYVGLIVKGMVSEYAQLMLHSYDIMKVFYGMGGGLRQSMGYQDISNLYIPVPPIDEQKAIVAYIEERVAKIDALSQKLQQEIENIKEYKQRLISDVVTGQIKVC